VFSFCEKNDKAHFKQFIIIIIIIIIIFFFLPRYSVPGDLEITNTEKKNYNGCNGLAGSERALK